MTERLCPYCKEPASGVAVGDDDWIDYCRECEVVIEGQTTIDHSDG